MIDDASDAPLSCQCCLQGGQQRRFKTPYVHQGKTETYSDMLEECFDIRINIESERFGICLVCVGRLRDASSFKRQVQRSQRELRSRLTASRYTTWLGNKHEGPQDEEKPAAAVKLETADEDQTSDNLPVLFESNEELDVKLQETAEDRPREYSLEEPALDLKLEQVGDAERGDDCWSDEDTISVKSECRDASERDGASHEDTISVKSECRDASERDGASPVRSAFALARAQLSMACCVRLERLDVSRLTVEHEANLTPHTQQAGGSTGDRELADAGDAGGLLKEHTKPKPFRCKMCDKSFCRKATMKKHVNIIHEGHKPHVCEACGKRFRRNYDYKRHFRVHTGQKPFSCDLCSKRFSQRANLKKHIKTHKGERSFGCDICNRLFMQKIGLIYHIRRHAGLKPYSCQICMKQFTDPSTYKCHVQTHTGFKPFSCDYCKKNFALKRHLRNHMRRHTGEKPYSCGKCNKRFYHQSNLDYHARTRTC